MIPDRYVYHLRRRPAGAPAERGPIAAPSLETHGFVHASFAGDVAGTHALHLAGAPDVEVLRIDPRRLDVPLRLEPTPRGTMPHVYGSIPSDAVVGVHAPGDELPDRVQDARFCFVAFRGMTLLDLVGVLDPIARLSSMGFAAHTSCEVVSADAAGEEASASDAPWSCEGASFTVTRRRPPLDRLDGFDVLVLAGGPGTRALVEDPSFARWLGSFPPNRLVATVCTGALLLGVTGRLRGRRATTHASALHALAALGAVVTPGRVVDEGQIVTSGGVTSGIDLGLHLVGRLQGEDVARAIAARMEWPGPIPESSGREDAHAR